MDATLTSPPIPDELRPLLDTVIDAVIILSPAGEVIAWNSVAEETFGWRADEAIGRMLGELIVPQQHRQAHNDGMKRLDKGGLPRLLRQRIELPALCKDGREISVELSITTTVGKDRTYFVGFLRDITERFRAQELMRRQLEEYELLLEVTRLAADASSFNDAMRSVLQTICELTGWEAGHAFLVDKNDHDLLHASSIWHERNDQSAGKMKAASDGISFRKGEGLPGQVLETDGPVWLSDINLAGNFIRKGNEFRGAFGFPLRSEGRVVAVLEFFSRERSSPDERLLVLTQALGSQLGRVLERSKTQEQREVLLHELNHRNKNLMTVIQSIAQTTFSGSSEPDPRVELFQSRLAAMARAQDVLVRGHWSDSTLREVIDATLLGFTSYLDRFTISGPDTPVPASDIQTLVLTIHELCTNALKYGALACEDGRVEIEWGYEGIGAEREFVFAWREYGCSLDGEPKHRGFGSKLLQRGMSQDAGSTVAIDYEPDGIRYHMRAPAPQ